MKPATLETLLYTNMNWDDACLDLSYEEVRALTVGWDASRPTTTGLAGSRSLNIEAEVELRPASDKTGTKEEEDEDNPESTQALLEAFPSDNDNIADLDDLAQGDTSDGEDEMSEDGSSDGD